LRALIFRQARPDNADNLAGPSKQTNARYRFAEPKINCRGLNSLSTTFAASASSENRTRNFRPMNSSRRTPHRRQPQVT
jgi:hypothetical protein